MKQETRKALNLTAEHAARALHALIEEGKLAIRDVTTALSRRKKLVKELKDRFTALETGGVAGTAKSRKAASRKAAGSRPRKAASRKTGKNRRELQVAARAKAAARSTAKAAGEATEKKTIARSARKKASTQKAVTKAATSRTPTRRPRTGTRPGTVRAKTTKPDQTATAAPAAEQKPRPRADTESSTGTSAPAPSTGGRRLPKVANPEHEGRGPAPRDWNPA